MFKRPIVDSLDFARKGMEISGELPIVEMPRMADLVTDNEGKISYVMRGFEGKDGKPLLELQIDGVCNLRCQRCLKTLTYPISLVSKLRLVNESELDKSDIENDEADNVPADKYLDVFELFEEELLLSLPIAPKHESGECRISEEGLSRPINPFAVLAGLKKK